MLIWLTDWKHCHVEFRCRQAAAPCKKSGSANCVMNIATHPSASSKHACIWISTFWNVVSVIASNCIACIHYRMGRVNAELLAWHPAGATEAVEREETLLRFLHQLESRVHTFTLPSGLTFVVLPRPEAPIVSFNITANVRSTSALHEFSVRVHVCALLLASV